MTRDWRRPLAWGITALVIGLCVTYVVFALNGALVFAVTTADYFWALVPVVTAIAAMLILVPRPRNTIGWLLLVWAAGTASGAIVEFPGLSIKTAPERLTLGAFLTIWFYNWSWVLLIFPVFHLLQVFPTGKVLNPRWRWLMRLEIFMVIAFLALLTFSQELTMQQDETTIWTIENPIGFIPPGFWETSFSIPWTAGLLVLTLGGAASSIVRYRRAQADEREQIKWLVYAVSMFALLYASFALVAVDWETIPGIVDSVFAVSLAAIPIAIAVAVLRFRLYDIDLVISRTIVYGALALFITGVYVAIVVGVGRLLGGGEEPNTFLSVSATALVAISVQPLRRRLQRIANRIVYGRRATPYQVLSDFSRRLAATDEHVIDQVAQSLAAGTSAHSAAVWVRSGERLQRRSVWPPDESSSEPIALARDDIPGSDYTVWVTHDGERLGALTLTFPRGQQATSIDERIVTELASGMGLALRNSALTENLHHRIEELRGSRRRIVEVQDTTRRQLERDLHDGAQQQLVALKVKLSLARRLAASSGAERTSEVLEGLTAEADSAIQVMRDLARGFYPPLLEAEGVVAAVTALARKWPMPVSVEVSGIGRYPHQVESSVYFCVLELLENIARHARAQSGHVSLSEEGDHLVFTVRDDGAGFDVSTTQFGNGLSNIADRVDALGGRFDIASTPGLGTTVTCHLPLNSMVPA